MSVSASFTFFSNNLNQLTWTVKLDSVVVTDAIVRATLYYGRDRINPDIIPGTAVEGFTNVALAYDVTSQTYIANLPAVAVPTGGDYMLVVIVKDASSDPVGQYERPAVVIQGGP